MNQTHIEARAKEMAAASGWFWPNLGETGRLGREFWREKARANIESTVQSEGGAA